MERAIAELRELAPLRPDELARAARRFRPHALAAGQVLELAEGDPTELVLVVEGRVEVSLPGGEHRLLYPGDTLGDLSVDTREQRPAVLRAAPPAGARASSGALLALLDRPGLKALLEEFPVVAVPLCEQMARELIWRNDLLRELQIIRSEQLLGVDASVALAQRRRKLGRRPAGIVRVASRALWRRLVVEREQDPAFWVLTGFLLALLCARLVVGTIITFNLQQKLFALIPSATGWNPVHVHHFNYGIALMVATGVVAFLPIGRRHLRPLALLLGVGLGLVVDEFALLWKLHPDYYQRESYVAIVVTTLLLLQLIYFRDHYLALLRRAAHWVRR
jgi:CRP-like cAMP-binding protein